jgi:hypothetical protein
VRLTEADLEPRVADIHRYEQNLREGDGNRALLLAAIFESRLPDLVAAILADDGAEAARALRALVAVEIVAGLHGGTAPEGLEPVWPERQAVPA